MESEVCLQNKDKTVFFVGAIILPVIHLNLTV